MKKSLIMIVLGVISSTILFSQDTIQQLKDVQVVGIRSDKREPGTITKVNNSYFYFMNQQKDPFVVLSQAAPSIYSQSDNGSGNGYNYLRMRGLDQTRINFNLNGIPLNEMEDQGIYFSNMPTFYNILSSTSIERGIGTSRYGNTSIGGSINMETIDMTQKSFDKNAILMNDIPVFNSQKGTNYDAFYSTGVNKSGLALQLGGGYLNSDGFKDHSGNGGGSLFYGLGIFKKNNIYKLYGFTGLAHNQLAFYGVPMDSINVSYKMNLNSPNDKDTFRQNLVVANWINKKSDIIKYNTSLYYNTLKGSYNTAGILFGVNSHQIGFMTNMVYSKANNNLNIGVNTNIYDRNHFGSDNNGYYDLPSNSKYYTNTGYKEDAIVYVKYIKTIDRVNLFADIQSRNVWFHAKSDSFSTQTYNWNFLNPKAGLKIIGMNNDWSLSFGNTKREPTRTDMIQNVVQTNNLQYANTDNINILKGYNSNLNPENAYNVEFGNSYHSKYLYFNFNLYYLTINNEYVANGNIDKYSGFMIKEVASKTVRYGIEGDGKFTQPVFFIGKLNFFWNFQYQYNKLTNNAVDSKITFCPDLTINGGVSFTGKSGITLGIYNQYVSSMIMNLGSTQNSSKPYFITNCFIDYRIDSHSIVSFKMNNLYNVKYYIPAGIGYTDANANYQSVPTYYVGQTINWNLTIKHTL